jgi:alpha-amylase
MHRQKIIDLFGVTPTAFRNTELIYNNELANFIQGMGYQAIVAEGADHIMGWRSPNFLYTPVTASNIKLMLKNYKLSDDIAFRFSNRGWAEYPLDAGRYANWISNVNGNGHVINLFMDYETFGEHQWEDTGIFEFLRHLPDNVFSHPDNNFVTVSEAAKIYPAVSELDVHNFISWADIERDLSAWLGNKMQHNAAEELYKVGRAAKETGDEQIIEDWRKLTTSDHLYYMCTKWFSDGDVHKYFNPYDTPYEGFIAFMNALNDLVIRVRVAQKKKEEETNPQITENSSTIKIATSTRKFITEQPSMLLNK